MEIYFTRETAMVVLEKYTSKVLFDGGYYSIKIVLGSSINTVEQLEDLLTKTGKQLSYRPAAGCFWLGD